MRYECDDPAFEGDFIEFSDSWSRAQVRAAWEAWANIPTRAEGVSQEQVDAAEEGLLAVLRPKIIGVHLTCVDAAPITDPAEVTPQRTAEMDTRLYSWWINTWIVHLRELANLGNALGQRLSATSAASGTTQPATLPKTTSKSKARRRRS